MIDTLDLANLEEYSTTDLNAVVKKINKELEKRAGGEIKKLQKQVEKLVKGMGYRLVPVSHGEDVEETEETETPSSPEASKKHRRSRKEPE